MLLAFIGVAQRAPFEMCDRWLLCKYSTYKPVRSKLFRDVCPAGSMREIGSSEEGVVESGIEEVAV